VLLPALEAAATVALIVITGTEAGEAICVEKILLAPVAITCSRVAEPFDRIPASVLI
jgi:hypothetical protein